MKTNNTATKTYPHINGKTIIYNELTASKELTNTWLKAKCVILNIKEEASTATYYYQDYIHKTETLTTSEPKTPHQLYWFHALNKPSRFIFRLTELTEETLGYIKYCLNNGIYVNINDQHTGIKEEYYPVSNNNTQSSTWENLNHQLEHLLSYYTIEESYDIYENYAKANYYKADKLSQKIHEDFTLEEAIDFISTWSKAYDIEPTFYTTDSTSDTWLPNRYYKNHDKISADKHRINEAKRSIRRLQQTPEYNQDEVVTLYIQLKYYRHINEPLSNPNYIICPTCNKPMHIEAEYCDHCGAEHIKE
jgi:hypothetical protein